MIRRKRLMRSRIGARMRLRIRMKARRSAKLIGSCDYIFKENGSKSDSRIAMLAEMTRALLNTP